MKVILFYEGESFLGIFNLTEISNSNFFKRELSNGAKWVDVMSSPYYMSPVFHTVESVRLSFYSKKRHTSSLVIKTSLGRRASTHPHLGELPAVTHIPGFAN